MPVDRREFLRIGGALTLIETTFRKRNHPVHLHRHSFELTRVGGEATAGVIEDVAMLGGYRELEVAFTADDPGLTQLHYDQQTHRDFGFMALIDNA